MNTKSFFNVFLVVFLVAIAANVFIAYLWSLYFPDSKWHWDTTTTTAAIIALAAGYISSKKK